MARASSEATAERAWSLPRFATLSSGSPLCRVPRNSPGAAQLEVLLGDDEAVGALLQHLQPGLGVEPVRPGG